MWMVGGRRGAVRKQISEGVGLGVNVNWADLLGR